LRANAIFNIVTTDEQWQRKPYFLNALHWNTAEPPCSIGIGHFNIERFIQNDICIRIQHQVLLDGRIAATRPYVGHILVKTIGLFDRKHCTVDESIKIFTFAERKEIESTLDGFCRNAHVIVHQ